MRHVKTASTWLILSNLSEICLTQKANRRTIIYHCSRSRGNKWVFVMDVKMRHMNALITQRIFSNLDRDLSYEKASRLKIPVQLKAILVFNFTRQLFLFIEDCFPDY